MSPFPIRHGPVPLDKRFSVEFAFDGERIDCVWSPRLPVGRKGRRLLPAYFAARAAFLGDVSKALGGNVLCIDVSAGGSA